jgi:type IV pilus assembly protein PilA
MLKKLWNKKNDKKGFTLVELIVVLIILAILAALLIPALTGYIDKAKNKQIIAETRQAVMAAQTLLDEEYAQGGGAALAVPDMDAIKELGEIEGTITLTTSDYNAKGKINKLIYERAGKVCTYYDPVPDGTTTTDGKYNVEDKE